jgi:hypothetical protein
MKWVNYDELCAADEAALYTQSNPAFSSLPRWC